MTTQEMTTAVMWHLKYKMGYPLVTTEAIMAIPSRSPSFFADVVGVKKCLITEIEIKQRRHEMRSELKSKADKHHFYLQPESDPPFSWNYSRWEKYLIRPHKFYFAYHLSSKNIDKSDASCYTELPEAYGLIIVYELHKCVVLKPAKWLHRDVSKLEDLRRRIMLRLTVENIRLRGA